MRGETFLTLAFMGALVSLSFSGCAHAPAQHPQRFVPPPATSPDILFRVAEAGPPLQLLKGIEASVIAGDGRVVLVGKTNGEGEVRVSKAFIRENRVSIVLFCGEWVFCGAVRVHDGKFDLLEYDEFFIELARLALL